MKRTLILALALAMITSPVAAQDSGGDSEGGFLQGFGEFVSGIAGSGADVGSQVVQRLGETINAGQASEALNNAVDNIRKNSQNVPDTGQTNQDVRSQEENEDNGIVPNNVVQGMVS